MACHTPVGNCWLRRIFIINDHVCGVISSPMHTAAVDPLQQAINPSQMMQWIAAVQVVLDIALHPSRVVGQHSAVRVCGSHLLYASHSALLYIWLIYLILSLYTVFDMSGTSC
jgi:hypothetical protein